MMDGWWMDGRETERERERERERDICTYKKVHAGYNGSGCFSVVDMQIAGRWGGIESTWGCTLYVPSNCLCLCASMTPMTPMTLLFILFYFIFLSFSFVLSIPRPPSSSPIAVVA